MNLLQQFKQRAGSLGRQVLALAGLGASVTNHAAVSGPGAGPVRVVVGLVGGLLLIVEHFVSDPSTGTPQVDPSAEAMRELLEQGMRAGGLLPEKPAGLTPIDGPKDGR